MVNVAHLLRIPDPVTDLWDWQLRSACREMDSAMFFHPDRERGQAKDERDRRAKAVCGRCPVVAQCRRHALQVREPYGVWGGLTVAERTEMVGRPTS